jgi:hypothetical protein
MVQWSQKQAPKEMAAMYNFRRVICWGSSCLILSLKIVTLLQMRRVQTISRLPYRRILLFSAFLSSNIFPTSADKYSKYSLFFQNEQKHPTLTLSNSLIVLFTFYIFSNSLHKIKRNFYELLKTFESSYFKSRCSHHPNYVLYLGKFMDVFDILQLFGKTFLKIC